MYPIRADDASLLVARGAVRNPPERPPSAPPQSAVSFTLPLEGICSITAALRAEAARV